MYASKLSSIDHDAYGEYMNGTWKRALNEYEIATFLHYRSSNSEECVHVLVISDNDAEIVAYRKNNMNDVKKWVILYKEKLRDHYVYNIVVTKNGDKYRILHDEMYILSLIDSACDIKENIIKGYSSLNTYDDFINPLNHSFFRRFVT